MTDPIVVASGVCQTFGPTQVLRDVSFQVRPGEVISILGSNGAGKTTLIDTLLGLTRPTSGSLKVFGTTPREAVRAGHVGAILQTGGLLPDITVAETVRMMAATYPAPRPLAEVMADARLDPIASRRISHCSAGEKQRVKFALALLANPDLIIFDEPTTGMDPSARHEFWQDIYARAERGTTIMFTTHYLEEAERFAQRIIFLSHGQIWTDGPSSEVMATASEPVVEFELDNPDHISGWDLGNYSVLGNVYPR